MSLKCVVYKLLDTNDDDFRKAIKHYNKTENDVKRDVGIIIEWLKQQPHLPNDEDNDRLTRMLLSNKFRVEVTKQKLEAYYTYRTIYGDLTRIYDAGDEFDEAIKHFIIVPLPKMTVKQERIIYFKPIPRENSSADYLLYILLFSELGQYYDTALSVIFFTDWSLASFDFITKLDLSFVQKLFNLTFNGLSVRLSKAAIYKAPTYFDIFFQLIKLVLKPKIIQRTSFHQKLDTVTEIIPKELLPVEYGGENGSVTERYPKFCDIIRNHSQFFKLLADRKSNEKLRTGPIKANELFGVDGSFKILNLD